MVKSFQFALLPELLAASFTVTKQLYVAHDELRGGREVQATLYLPDSNEPGPAVSFAHGFNLGPELYPLAEELAARRGCVVFSPHDSGAPSTKNLALDQTFLVSHAVQQASNASSPLFGRVSNTTLIMGHSLGGGSTILAVDQELAGQYPTPTAIATVSLGTYTIPGAMKSAPRLPLGMPALLMTATQDCIDPPEKNSMPVFDAIQTQCASVISVVGGTHCQYAAQNAGCSLTERLCGAKPNVTREEQTETALDILLPYVDAVVDAKPASWDAFAAAVATAESAGRVQVLGRRDGGCDGRIWRDLDESFPEACQRLVANVQDASLTVEVLRATKWQFTTTKPTHTVDEKNVTHVSMVTHVESTTPFSHSLAIKMESRAGLGRGTDATSCAELHDESLKTALQALTAEQRSQYGKATKRLVFLPDREYHTGLYVLSAKLNVTETGEELLVEAPSFLAAPGLPHNWGGKRYCRLLPPNAIRDWILEQLIPSALMV